MNYFEELSRINCLDKIEKKGKFSYLPWAVAVQELGIKHPNATWEVKRFDGMPFLKTEIGYFVEVSVTVDEVTKSQIHPVINSSNKPIENPNTFDINTSIQRCLAKAIALHGLGLSIYYGEDILPALVDEIANETDTTDFESALESAVDLKNLFEIWGTIPKELHKKLKPKAAEVKARLEQ